MFAIRIIIIIPTHPFFISKNTKLLISNVLVTAHGIMVMTLWLSSWYRAMLALFTHLYIICFVDTSSPGFYSQRYGCVLTGLRSEHRIKSKGRSICRIGWCSTMWSTRHTFINMADLTSSTSSHRYAKWYTRALRLHTLTHYKYNINKTHK